MDFGFHLQKKFLFYLRIHQIYGFSIFSLLIQSLEESEKLVVVLDLRYVRFYKMYK
jgi:hypothetical protein